MKRMQARAADRIARFDANGDGKVSKEEFDAYRGKRFALLDRTATMTTSSMPRNCAS